MYIYIYIYICISEIVVTGSEMTGRPFGEPQIICRCYQGRSVICS